VRSGNIELQRVHWAKEPTISINLGFDEAECAIGVWDQRQIFRDGGHSVGRGCQQSRTGRIFKCRGVVDVVPYSTVGSLLGISELLKIDISGMNLPDTSTTLQEFPESIPADR
jgi:hypothetical protein